MARREHGMVRRKDAKSAARHDTLTLSRRTAYKPKQASWGKQKAQAQCVPQHEANRFRGKKGLGVAPFTKHIQSIADSRQPRCDAPHTNRRKRHRNEFEGWPEP